MLLSLEKLAANLVKENIQAKIIAREDEYEKRFKQASKTSSEYDSQTGEMIKLLHKTRDEQVTN